MGEKVIIQSGDLELEGLLRKKHRQKRGGDYPPPSPVRRGHVQYDRSIPGEGLPDEGLLDPENQFQGCGQQPGQLLIRRWGAGRCAGSLSALQDMGIDHLAIAGYSFGAWVNALAVSEGAGIPDGHGLPAGGIY